jgi:RHS repeat-associated protein
LNDVYQYDANGNVGQLVDLDPNDPNGVSSAIVAHYEYDPYGNRVNFDPNSPSYDGPFRFSTKQFDEETGQYYFGYRYYSPGLGRWMSCDPIGKLGGVNVYAYVLNSPAVSSDALGLL